MSISDPEYIVIGRVTRPHGVAGEVRVEMMTEDSGRFSDVETVLLSRRDRDPVKPYTIDTVRFHKGQALLKFKEIRSREEADRLRGHFVRVPYSEAIPLEEGEFFLFQLYGMRVETVEGESIGEVVDVLQTGANDVFVVRSDTYGELLIPDIEDVVRSVDGSTRLIKIAIIDGLIS